MEVAAASKVPTPKAKAVPKAAKPKIGAAVPKLKGDHLPKTVELFEKIVSECPELARRVADSIKEGGWCATLRHQSADGTDMASTVQVHFKHSGNFYATNVEPEAFLDEFLKTKSRKRNGQKGVPLYICFCYYWHCYFLTTWQEFEFSFVSPPPPPPPPHFSICLLHFAPC
jgi:hypothetical protein